MAPARVLIVDDSALIRELLRSILSSDPAIEVVGCAPNPIAAWAAIQELRPDVITLDVEMPRMDGITFLERLMRIRPMPVLMVSSYTDDGAETTLRALELGAFDFVTKPKLDIRSGTMDRAAEIVAKVKAAASSRPRQRRASPPAPVLQSRAALRATDVVVAIGASTGGTEAIREVLTALPPDAPGIVIVQHMPEKFTRQFADNLDRCCRVRVREASDGDRITRGLVLIAPGGTHHMEVVRHDGVYEVRLSATPPCGFHRPSIDVLFESCAANVGANTVGVILTGMGRDGARGLAEMRRCGARTIAQDEATSVVFGMPAEAIRLDAAEVVAPLHAIGETLLRMSEREPAATSRAMIPR